jgi:hypothetical protein
MRTTGRTGASLKGTTRAIESASNQRSSGGSMAIPRASSVAWFATLEREQIFRRAGAMRRTGATVQGVTEYQTL